MIVNYSAADRAFHRGPYADPTRTVFGPVSQTLPDQGTIGRTPHTQAATDSYNVAGTNFRPGSQPVRPYPPAPAFWRRGRDPYALGGLDEEVNPYATT